MHKLHLYSGFGGIEVKRIVFTIKEDGTIETDASGYKGPQCEVDVENILKDLQPQKVSRRLKPEYNVVDTQQKVRV